MKTNKIINMVVAGSLLFNTLNPSLAYARQFGVNNLSYESFKEKIGNRTIYVFNKKEAQLKYNPFTGNLEFSSPGIGSKIINDNNFLRTLYNNRYGFSWDEFDEGSTLEVYSESLDISLKQNSIEIGTPQIKKGPNIEYRVSPKKQIEITPEVKTPKKPKSLDSLKKPNLERLLNYKNKISPRPITVNQLEYHFDQDTINVPRIADLKFLDSVYVALDTEITRNNFERMTLNQSNQDYMSLTLNPKPLNLEMRTLQISRNVNVTRLKHSTETLIELGLKKPDTTKRKIVYGLAAFSLGIMIGVLTDDKGSEKKTINDSEPINPIR